MKKLIRFCVRKIPRPILIKFSWMFSFLISPFYYGKGHVCPICGKSFRKFLPYGKNGVDDRLCPKCLSLERHRLMWLYWKQNEEIFTKNLKVLHIAPEQPFLTRFRKLKNLEYVTADLESPIADLHFDIMNIPLPDESFDYIICNHVLEHVEDDMVALKEFNRVLKKGGTAILQVPINKSFTTTYEDKNITTPEDREKYFGQYDHLRWHGLDYPQRVESVGFTHEEFNPTEKFSAEDITLYRLDSEEVLYVFKKKD